MRYDTKKMMDEISIRDVFERLNFNITRGNKVLCPFHNDTKPSMVLYEETNQYHCFACDAHGNIFSIVMEELNCDFTKAINWLAKEFNIQGEKSFKKRNRYNSDDILKKYMEMTTPEREKFISFSAARNFDNAYLESQGLFLSKKNKLKKKVINDPKLLSEMNDFGYITSYVDRYEKIVYSDFSRQERVIIPIYNESNILSGMMARSINSKDAPKYLYNKGFIKSKNIYNIHGVKKKVDEWTEGEFNLHITEGVFDALRIESLGDNAIAILGASISNAQIKMIDEVLEPIKGKSPINLYIFLDFDNAGYKGRLKAVKSMITTELGAATNIKVVISDKELDKINDPDSLLSSINILEAYKKYSVVPFEFLFRYFIKDKDSYYNSRAFDQNILELFSKMSYYQQFDLINSIRNEFSRKELSMLFDSKDFLNSHDYKYYQLLFNDYTKYLFKDLRFTLGNMDEETIKLDKLRALTYAKKSYKREEICLDQETWNRIEINSDFILDYICDFKNQKQIKQPLVAFDIPKKSNGEDRRKMMYCHEQLIVQQYFLNEFLKISLDNNLSIPGVFYNQVNKSKYTGGFNNTRLSDKVVSFAYQIETESLTTSSIESINLFRDYFECWKDYLTYINESVAEISGEELYFVKLDLSKYYDRLPSYHVRNIFKKAMVDSSSSEERKTGTFKISTSKFEIDTWLDWIINEAFDYEFFEPSTGNVTNKTDQNISIPQGPNLSAYIGNISLFGIDEAVVEKIDQWHNESKSSVVYARYVDDMVIVSNRRDYITSLVELISVKLNDIALPLNQEKKSIERMSKNEIYDELSTQNNPWGSYVSETIVEDFNDILDNSSYVQYTDREDLKKLMAASDFKQVLEESNYGTILRAIFKSRETRFNDAVRIVKILIKFKLENVGSLQELYDYIQNEWYEYIRFSPNDSLLRREDVYIYAFIEAVSRLLKGSHSNLYRIEDLNIYINIKKRLSTFILNLEDDCEFQSIVSKQKKNSFILRAKCFSVFCDSKRILESVKKIDTTMHPKLIELAKNEENYFYLRYYLQLTKQHKMKNLPIVQQYKNLKPINVFYYFTIMTDNIKDEIDYKTIASMYKPVIEKYSLNYNYSTSSTKTDYKSMLDIIFTEIKDENINNDLIWTTIKYLRINSTLDSSINVLNLSKTLCDWLENSDGNLGSPKLLPYLNGINIESLYRTSMVRNESNITRFSYNYGDSDQFQSFDGLVEDEINSKKQLRKQIRNISKVYSIESYLEKHLDSLEDEGTRNLITDSLIRTVLDLFHIIDNELKSVIEREGYFPALSYENIYVSANDKDVEQVYFINDKYKVENNRVNYWVRKSDLGSYIKQEIEKTDAYGFIVAEVIYDALSKMDSIKYQVRNELEQEKSDSMERNIKIYERNYDVLNCFFRALGVGNKIRLNKSVSSFNGTFKRYEAFLHRYIKSDATELNKDLIIKEIQFENQFISMISNYPRSLDKKIDQEKFLIEWANALITKHTKEFLGLESVKMSSGKLPKRREVSVYYSLALKLFELSKNILEVNALKLLSISFFKLCLKKNLLLQIHELLTVMNDDEINKLKNSKPEYGFLIGSGHIELLGLDEEEQYNKMIDNILKDQRLEDYSILSFQGLQILFYQLLESKTNLSTNVFRKNRILKNVSDYLIKINKLLQTSKTEKFHDYPYNKLYQCFYDEDVKLYDKVFELINEIDKYVGMSVSSEVDERLHYTLRQNRVNIYVKNQYYSNIKTTVLFLNMLSNKSTAVLRNNDGEYVYSVTQYGDKLAGVSIISQEMISMLNIIPIGNIALNVESLAKEELEKSEKVEIESSQKTLEKTDTEKDKNTLKYVDNIENGSAKKTKPESDNDQIPEEQVIEEFANIQSALWTSRARRGKEYSRIALFQYDSFCTYHTNLDEVRKFHPYDTFIEEGYQFSSEELRRYILIKKAIDISLKFDVEILVLPEYSIRYETVIRILDYLNSTDNYAKSKISLWLGTFKISNRKTFNWIKNDSKRKIGPDVKFYEDEAVLPVITHNGDKYKVVIERSKKYPSISSQEVFNPMRHIGNELMPIMDSIICNDSLKPVYKDARDYVTELICSELFMMSIPANYDVMVNSSLELAKLYLKAVDEQKFDEVCKRDTEIFGKRTKIGCLEEPYFRKSIVLCPAFTTRPVDHYVISQAGYLGAELTTVFCNSANEESHGGSCIIGLNSWDKKCKSRVLLPTYLEYPNSEPGIYHQWNSFDERNALSEKEQTLLIVDINPTRAIDSKPRPQTCLNPLRLIAHIPFVEINDGQVRFDKKYTTKCFMNYKDLLSTEVTKIQNTFSKDSNISDNDYNELLKNLDVIKKYFDETEPSKRSEIFYKAPQILSSNSMDIVLKSLKALKDYSELANKVVNKGEDYEVYKYSKSELYEIAYCLVHISVLSNSKTLFMRTKKFIEALDSDPRAGFISAFYDFTVVDTSINDANRELGTLFIEKQDRSKNEGKRIDFGTYE